MGRGGTLTLSPPDFSLFTAPASAGRCFVKDSAMKEALTVNPDLTNSADPVCRITRDRRFFYFFCHAFFLALFCRGLASRKGFGLLVSLGCRRYRLCTCDLSTSSSLTTLYGNLILRGASCLDAFSTYPCQTRLPGGAPGGTTGKPEVCPTRSSRTSVGSSQISCAHNR